MKVLYLGESFISDTTLPSTNKYKKMLLPTFLRSVPPQAVCVGIFVQWKAVHCSESYENYC